jgi:chromosome segregation ATPase
LDESVFHLECSKAQTEDDEKKWRPTTHSVNEIMCPTVVKELMKQKRILQKQLEYQNSTLESLIPAVDQHRKDLKARIDRRKEVEARIDGDTTNVLKSSDEIDNLMKSL